MNFSFFSRYSILLAFALLLLSSCSDDDGFDDANDDDSADDLVVSVDQSLFQSDGSNLSVTTISCTLSDGTTTECLQIVTNGTPSDHDMGPWCPTNISDDASAGGIWLESDEVFDVDGAFVANMATFYNDDTWQMFDDNGDIFVTETQEDCINAANPNVGDAYRNFCIECLLSYITDLSNTWVIPITPVFQQTVTEYATGPGGGGNNVPSTRGIALNGVEFSAPAPVNNILSLYAGFIR